MKASWAAQVLRSQWLPSAILAGSAALLSTSATLATQDDPTDPNETAPPASAQIDVKHGTTPRVDGVFTQGEWDDASSVEIDVEPGWKVKVQFKHDEKNLYVAFTNLKNRGLEMYPEVLLDTAADGGTKWLRDDWWLHASYSDCESQGRFNVYECKPDLFGWKASNFPLNGPGIEIKVSYGKMGLKPVEGKALGIAFDVTDTEHVWSFWPPTAKMDNPSTWGRATSSDGWR